MSRVTDAELADLIAHCKRKQPTYPWWQLCENALRELQTIRRAEQQGAVRREVWCGVCKTQMREITPGRFEHDGDCPGWVDPSGLSANQTGE